MSNDERNLVEDPTAHEDIETARNMPDAANAQQSLEGYAAINSAPDSEIAQLAYELYQQRGEEQTGDADGDWFRAEQEVRRRRQQRGS
ncbi:MAG TPA: DUF2934 domain-containing protein [Bryobacteraceae bacterium]|nr:DUF2934 domain-containing protein [Bryobacteraceae bacterium]